MTEVKKHWITDANGVKAVIEGADALAEWTRVRGWSEATEPVGYEFQWVRNAAPDHHGKGVMNHEALLLAEGRGWVACGPEGYDEPTDSPAARPSASASTKPAASAVSGDKKE